MDVFFHLARKNFIKSRSFGLSFLFNNSTSLVRTDPKPDNYDGKKGGRGKEIKKNAIAGLPNTYLFEMKMRFIRYYWGIFHLGRYGHFCCSGFILARISAGDLCGCRNSFSLFFLVWMFAIVERFYFIKLTIKKFLFLCLHTRVLA